MHYLVFALVPVLAVFISLYLAERKKNIRQVEEKPQEAVASKEEKTEKAPETTDEKEERQKPNTRDFLLEMLTKMGCKYEIGEENGRIEFKWQGGFFIADATNDSPFITVWYLQWDEYELYDIDQLSRVKRVINDTNINYDVMVFYSINKEGNNFYVHSKSHFLFIRQIPDAESYLMAMLANFFMVRRSVEVELDKLTNAES